MSFACQLERCGLWWWAVFVIMHIDHPALREAAVRRVLGQHCTSDEELTEQEAFVVEKLRVSRNWVYEAKGQSAGYELNFELQALHFLKAERWNDCHTVIMEHLAANAIVNGEQGFSKFPEGGDQLKARSLGYVCIIMCMGVNQ
jgi:nuclear pore complex protein Nup98-Nup96